MAPPNQTFATEAFNAMACFAALVTGKRDAASHFDFSRRGLVGSLIAVLLGLLLAGYGPLLLGMSLSGWSPAPSIIFNTALYGAQAGMAWIVLRQMGRPDGFVPYLVASNWVTLTSSLLLFLSLLLGGLGVVILLAMVLAALLTFINIGRFVVTLSPLQIGLLFLSQAVGVVLALGLVAPFLPPLPTA